MEGLENLRVWWMAKAEAEWEAIEPKVWEYSAVDLQIMGEAAMGRVRAVDRDEYRRAGYGQQSAIAFYALGKVARITGALEEGRLPSEDSWFDLSVYAKMAQRVGEVGGWPNGR
jgi:hypothetical protein